MDEARSDAVPAGAVEDEASDPGRPAEEIINGVFAMSYVTAQHESLALGAMMERRMARRIDDSQPGDDEPAEAGKK